MIFIIFLVYILVYVNCSHGNFVPVCPQNCPEEDFFRSHPYKTLDNEKFASDKIRIAFVFAGTPRSLVLPPIYESIHENLIASFCPKKYCISDVYVRVSTSDNTHSGLDSVGVLKTNDDESLLPKIKYAISHLNPQDDNGGGITEIDWTDIGSEKEKNEMLNSPFTSRRHKIFRTLDPRRYSMYFNRWSAYQMAIKKEIELGFKYTWIVHSRLDSAFGEPVRDFRDWSPEYVYVPDTWWSDVPDTFALLYRKWSDSFYDLEPLVDKSGL